MKYEVWSRTAIGSYAKSRPESEHYTIDTAMIKAKELSKGEEEIQVWDYKKQDAAISIFRITSISDNAIRQ
jgi:hypothetical protein